MATKKRVRPTEAQLGRPLTMTEMGLNPNQQMFVVEYMKDMDRAGAYIRAGYGGDKAKEDMKTAYQNATNLLSNPLIKEAIDRFIGQRMNRVELDVDWALARFKRIYLEAIDQQDWSAACRALENIGKYLGMYEKDNKQKTYSESDVQRLQTELKERGFDMTRVNFPNPSKN